MTLHMAQLQDPWTWPNYKSAHKEQINNPMSEEKSGNIFCKAFLLLFRRFLGFYDVIGLQQVLWMCLPLSQVVAIQIDS